MLRRRGAIVSMRSRITRRSLGRLDMARRAGAKKKAARKAAPKRAAQKSARAIGADAAASLRQALLQLVETQGWIDLSFAEIAEQAGVPIAEAHRIYSSKTAVLLALT